MAEAATKPAAAKAAESKKPGRPAREIKPGSTWKRRSDGAEVKVVKLGKDTIVTKRVGVKDAEESTSKLQFFRRRFQHVKG